MDRSTLSRSRDHAEAPTFHRCERLCVVRLRHVTVCDDAEVRQQFSICFACSIIGGQLLDHADGSLEIGFYTPEQIENMPMHPSIRLRIAHYLEHRPEPVIA